MKTNDHPGVYVPPPLIYAGVFMIAVLLQKRVAINPALFQMHFIWMPAVLLLAIGAYFCLRSIGLFIRTKNTVMTIRPAASLQTGGIYHITRNPMYLSLLFIYLGLTCLIGSWWNIILLPLLVLIVQQYIIRREEKYLSREFGQAYTDYKNQVRRWL